MLKTFVTAAAIASLLALAGCNTTSAPVPSTTNHPPSPDGANPSVNPDGTVKRLYVTR
jgi:hypothetical protein